MDTDDKDEEGTKQTVSDESSEKEVNENPEIAIAGYNVNDHLNATKGVNENSDSELVNNVVNKITGEERSTEITMDDDWQPSTKDLLNESVELKRAGARHLSKCEEEKVDVTRRNKQNSLEDDVFVESKFAKPRAKLRPLKKQVSFDDNPSTSHEEDNMHPQTESNRGLSSRDSGVSFTSFSSSSSDISNTGGRLSSDSDVNLTSFSRCPSDAFADFRPDYSTQVSQQSQCSRSSFSSDTSDDNVRGKIKESLRNPKPHYTSVDETDYTDMEFGDLPLGSEISRSRTPLKRRSSGANVTSPRQPSLSSIGSQDSITSKIDILGICESQGK